MLREISYLLGSLHIWACAEEIQWLKRCLAQDFVLEEIGWTLYFWGVDFTIKPV